MMEVPKRNFYVGYGKLKTRNEAQMVLVGAIDWHIAVRLLERFLMDVQPAMVGKDLVIVYLANIKWNLILIEYVVTS